MNEYVRLKVKRCCILSYIERCVQSDRLPDWTPLSMAGQAEISGGRLFQW